MAISMDMKYTALYWALRFVENELDVHLKDYSGYKIMSTGLVVTEWLWIRKVIALQRVLCPW